MEYVFFFVIGATIGWFLAQYFYMNALQNILEALDVSEDDLRKVADDMGITVPAKPSQTVEIDGETYEYDDYVEVRVEKVGTRLFAYRDDTDVFITQSDDPNELIDALVNHFPPKTRVNIAPDNGGEYLKDLA